MSDSSEQEARFASPFIRSRKVARTPPQRRERVDSAGEKRKRDTDDDQVRHPVSTDTDCKETDYEDEEVVIVEEPPETKRKKAMSPKEENDLAKLRRTTDSVRKLYEEMMSDAVDLRRLVEGVPNTQKDIKTLIKSMYRRQNLLEEHVFKLDKYVGRAEAWISKARTEMESENRVTTVDAGTQTEVRQTKKRAYTEEERRTEIAITEVINSAEGLPGLKKAMELEWPRSCFEKVSEDTGDLLALTRDWDLMTFVTQDLSMEDGVNKRFRERFQGTEELKDQGVEVRKVAHLVESVNIPEVGGKTVAKGRHVYYAVVAGNRWDTWNIDDVYESLLEVKRCTNRDEVRKLAVAVPMKVNAKWVRGLFEYIFRDSETVIKVVKEKRKSSPRGKIAEEEKGQIKPRKRPGEEAVILKAAGGMQYADMLRKVKQVASDGALGVEISAVKKTRAGDLLLAVKSTEGVGQATRLKAVIEGKMENIQVVARTDKPVTIHVYGVDGIADKAEVEEAVCAEVGASKEEINVKSMWLAFGGNQNASLEMPKKYAAQLLGKGRVKIGLTFCRLRERVEVIKCFKCWESGHIAAQCTGVDRKDQCMKCTQVGHLAKDCTSAAVCWECKRVGHRGGTTSCPAFRKALEELASR